MSHTPSFRQFLCALQKAHRANLAADGQPPPLTPEEARRLGLHRWSRRRLLKSAAIATGTALATTTLSRWEKAWSRDTPEIAIIGGGMAGLNAAYQLQKAGLKSTVYEARNRLGGRILSATGIVGEGLVTDLGGSLINTNHEDILALAKEFDLKLFDRAKDAQKFPFPETAYYFAGKLRSEAELAEKLRPLAQQISQDADLIDKDFDRFAPQFDRLSVTAYLDQHTDKIPEPFIRTLVENSIRTEFGVEPQDSSALQLLFNLPTVKGKKVEVLGNSDERFVVEGGSGKIIDSLSAALSAQIQTGMRLSKLESKKPGFRLTFADNKVIEADWVIVAIPFPVLRDLEIKVKLPAKLRRFINEVSLGVNEKLIAGFNSRSWRQSDGFVEEIWTDLGFSEAWDETQRQAARKDGALTFYFGAREVPQIQSGSTPSQGEKILDQFEQAIPGAKAAANGKFSRTEWTKEPLTQGGYTNFKPGQLTEFGEFLYIESNKPEERQEVRVGNLLFVGEQVSDEFCGYMNGAAQTGRLAAEIIMREQA